MSSRKVANRTNTMPISSQEYNIALLGALGAGKSALTVKYITKRFIMEYDPYIEGIYTKQETMDNQEMVIRIMDTCDKEDSDANRYLKWADGFIVVYSITSRQSFDDATTFLENVTQYQRITGKYYPLALLGNKADLERYRQISSNEGSSLATQYECMFYESSAAEEYIAVETVFHDIIREIMRERERQMPLQPLFISEDKHTFLSPGNSSNTNALRRTKSPKNASDKKEDDKPRPVHKKSVSSFRLFNKSFKIFN